MLNLLSAGGDDSSHGSFTILGRRQSRYWQSRSSFLPQHEKHACLCERLLQDNAPLLAPLPVRVRVCVCAQLVLALRPVVFVPAEQAPTGAWPDGFAPGWGGVGGYARAARAR
eukprot:47381-Pleurochrysis_carterae.AAC.1